jgi:hypothetical protein
VKFSWAAPNDRSSALTAYEIQILKSDGENYAEEVTYCDGSRTAVVDSLNCHVPMTTLRADPYFLSYGGLLVAKVRAKNSVGWGPYSDPNGVGAYVQTEPTTSTTPIPTRGSRTDDTRVEVTWTEITLPSETGGAPITSYNL